MVKPAAVCIWALASGCSAQGERAQVELPPPSAVQEIGKPMLTTHGFIHPTDPPGTWRASRPHHRAIEPCSDWLPGGPLTDDYGKTTSGPKSIHMGWGSAAERGRRL